MKGKKDGNQQVIFLKKESNVYNWDALIKFIKCNYLYKW